MIRLTTIENRFEADLISDALTREGIGFLIRSYQDTAYDGLYVTQKGFAALMVEEQDADRARAIVRDIRASVENS
ncbi:MAG: DUF2007 domain-containing protein [Proteobacteria bacterium]|nr:DUF2007 domain-containing protein [Pseudomonadota bacterium]